MSTPSSGFNASGFAVTDGRSVAFGPLASPTLVLNGSGTVGQINGALIAIAPSDGAVIFGGAGNTIPVQFASSLANIHASFPVTGHISTVASTNGGLKISSNGGSGGAVSLLGSGAIRFAPLGTTSRFTLVETQGTFTVPLSLIHI